MTCREFECAWNELLDAEASVEGATRSEGQPNPSMAERERAMLEHAVRCPACSDVNARYLALRRAIRAWGPPPAPSAGLTDRILAETQRPRPSAWPVYGTVRRELPKTRVMISISAAAMAASLLLGLVLDRSIIQRRRNDRITVLHNTPSNPGRNESRDSSTLVFDSRALNVALSEATAATWDLARSASEPAARISRQVLDAATGPDRGPDQGASVTGSVVVAVSVPSLDSLAPDTAAAGAMLQQVSDRLANGVRPLSDTARHAFGFLLGTALAKPEVPVNTPAQKGA
jgi:hypothetical protein